MKRGINYTGKGSKLSWSDGDIAYLCAHFHEKSLEELADHFRVSTTTVRVKALGFGLRKPRKSRGHNWTEAELHYLIENFPTVAGCDIADHLHLSPPCISCKAKELGLKKSPEFSTRPYTKRYVRNYKHAV